MQLPHNGFNLRTPAHSRLGFSVTASSALLYPQPVMVACCRHRQTLGIVLTCAKHLMCACLEKLWTQAQSVSYRSASGPIRVLRAGSNCYATVLFLAVRSSLWPISPARTTVNLLSPNFLPDYLCSHEPIVASGETIISFQHHIHKNGV